MYYIIKGPVTQSKISKTENVRHIHKTTECNLIVYTQAKYRYVHAYMYIFQNMILQLHKTRKDTEYLNININKLGNIKFCNLLSVNI